MKGELRREILKKRNEMTGDEVLEKSTAIIKKLLALEDYKQSAVVMAYLDFRNEVKTGKLVKDAVAGGKKVLVPVTDKANKRLIPSLIENYPGDIAPGTWGIPEPKPGRLKEVDPLEIDLVIVPGVAYDIYGNRIGYGGGYYDRFLPRTKPGVVTMAPAYEFQVRDWIGSGKHDWPVDYIVTEKRIIDAKNNRQLKIVQTSKQSAKGGSFYGGM